MFFSLSRSTDSGFILRWHTELRLGLFLLPRALAAEGLLLADLLLARFLGLFALLIAKGLVV